MSKYYAIVTFGSFSYGRIRSYYRNPERARADAAELGGGSLQDVRVVACATRAEAIAASIGDHHEVVAHIR